MDLSEYLEKLTGQIRCRQARPMVEEEIKNHIVDQAEAYCRSGMEKSQALAAAVKEMGDPVAVGTRLDQIHRPKMEWSVLLFAAVLSIVSLLIQFLFYYFCGAEDHTNLVVRQLGSVVIGFAMMLVVYRTDYTFLGKCAMPLWIALSIFCLITLLMNGDLVMMGYGQKRIFFYSISLFCMPIYAGVLFWFRGKGYGGLLCSALLLLVPINFARLSSSGAAWVQTAVIGVLMLAAAIYRGWFRVNQRKTLIGLLGSAVCLPPALLFGAMKTGRLAGYQMDRINAMLHAGRLADNGSVYHINRVRAIVSDAKLLGESELPNGFGLNGMTSDYMITGLFAYYGVLAGTVVVCLVFLFLLHILKIAWKQKNQLGSMMAMACALIFVMQSVIYINGNLRGSMIAQMYLPFLSYGRTMTIVNFMLLGIFLSVYRGSRITNEKQIPNKKYRITIVREP